MGRFIYGGFLKLLKMEPETLETLFDIGMAAGATVVLLPVVLGSCVGAYKIAERRELRRNPGVKYADDGSYSDNEGQDGERE
jgi:hypothetical protein